MKQFSKFAVACVLAAPAWAHEPNLMPCLPLLEAFQSAGALLDEGDAQLKDLIGQCTSGDPLSLHDAARATLKADEFNATALSFRKATQELVLCVDKQLRAAAH